MRKWLKMHWPTITLVAMWITVYAGVISFAVYCTLMTSDAYCVPEGPRFKAHAAYLKRRDLLERLEKAERRVEQLGEQR